jgi:hypothetical protein
MENADVFARFANTFAAKQVYSEPCTVDGITVITAAAVGGGVYEERQQRTRRCPRRHGRFGEASRCVHRPKWRGQVETCAQS